MNKKWIGVTLACSLFASFHAPVLADDKDDRIAELESEIVELQTTIEELQEKLSEAEAKQPSSTSNEEYKIGDTWVVEGQWKLTIDSVEEVEERNEYSDYQPDAVYLLTYTYENLGYEDDIMDGLYISLDNGIVDSDGKMGYSYPGDVTLYPQETPVGASCEAQVCIGVDHAGSFKINCTEYDGNYEKHSAVFSVEVESK